MMKNILIIILCLVSFFAKGQDSVMTSKGVKRDTASLLSAYKSAIQTNITNIGTNTSNITLARLISDTILPTATARNWQVSRDSVILVGKVGKDSAVTYTFTSLKNNDLIKWDSLNKVFVNFSLSATAPLTYNKSTGVIAGGGAGGGATDSTFFWNKTNNIASLNSAYTLNIGNTSSGTGASAGLISTNNVGSSLFTSIVGSGYPFYTLANQGFIASTTGLVIATDAAVSSGGNNDIEFRTQGLTATNAKMKIWRSGQVSIGSTMDSTVDFNLNTNVNRGVVSRITNVSTGSAATAVLQLVTTSGASNLFRTGPNYNTYKSLHAGDFGVYNSGGGNIDFFNDFNSGKITFLSGGASTEQMTLQTTGELSIGSTATVASSQLTVSSTTKGTIPAPVMTLAQRNAISTPAAGLVVYCSDCTATDTSTGVNQTYNGSTWKNWW